MYVEMYVENLHLNFLGKKLLMKRYLETAELKAEKLGLGSEPLGAPSLRMT